VWKCGGAEVRVEARLTPTGARRVARSTTSGAFASFAGRGDVAHVRLAGPHSAALVGSTPTCSWAASALGFMRHGGGCVRAKGLGTNSEIGAGFGCRFRFAWLEMRQYKYIIFFIYAVQMLHCIPHLDSNGWA
jgi:hypothetical protein